jgi:sugar (pentulose or hexulose) kinase
MGTEATENAYPKLYAMPMAADAFVSFLNPDAPDFANPASMVKAIQEYCRRTSQPVPETKAAITRCIFESLALRYRQVLESLNKFAPAPISILHVIGGGSKNAMLNQFTSNALGIRSSHAMVAMHWQYYDLAKAAGFVQRHKRYGAKHTTMVELRFERQNTSEDMGSAV